MKENILMISDMTETRYQHQNLQDEDTFAYLNSIHGYYIYIYIYIYMYTDLLDLTGNSNELYLFLVPIR